MSVHESKSPKKFIQIACGIIAFAILASFLYCVNSLIDKVNLKNKQKAEATIECYKKAGRDNMPYQFINGKCILEVEVSK
ncbi:hypothetical protein MYO4S_00264 [Serratia phage 4S]|nr:hypothetical protein MYO4S_00264 [Serratia phage 4S]